MVIKMNKKIGNSDKHLKDLHPELRQGTYHRLHRLTKLAAPYIGRILGGKDVGFSWRTACALADAAGVTMDEFRAHVEAMREEREREIRMVAETEKGKRAAAIGE